MEILLEILRVTRRKQSKKVVAVVPVLMGGGCSSPRPNGCSCGSPKVVAVVLVPGVGWGGRGDTIHRAGCIYIYIFIYTHNMYMYIYIYIYTCVFYIGLHHKIA